MRGPIFIVGTMRSGSTLLRLVLDSHEHIAIGDETGFMRAATGIKDVPDFHSGAGWYRRFGLTEADIDERIRRFYTEVFSGYAARQGKGRWGEKTPFHAMYMREMATMFPDCVFVGTVRHPGAVAVSKMRRTSTLEHSIANWVRVNSQLVRMSRTLAGQGRLAAVRYEDLVAHTEPTLRQLMAFLGEPWSPGLLEHHRVQRDKGTPRMSDGGTRTREAIDPGRVDEWHGRIAPGQLRRVAEATASLRQVFGYDERGAVDLDAGVCLLDGERLR
ncbi:MAG: sulfotransferase, partial [Actinomycetota bacterium]|nr:sulfotransferase [Actinomycetota bacterium]